LRSVWDEWEQRRASVVALIFAPATEKTTQRVDENLEHKINVVIGLFVLSCLACTIFYGFDMIVVCVLGLFIIAAILNRLAA
jgi:cobalamin synthase